MISQITSRFYIGSKDDIPNLPFYLNVIFNIAYEYDIPPKYKEEYTVYEFDLFDEDFEQVHIIRMIVKLLNEVIDDTTQDNKVFLCCAGGISRSSIVAICYMYGQLENDWEEAEDWVKTCHPASKLLNQRLLDITKEKF